MVLQHQVTLRAKVRGVHLITDEIVSHIKGIDHGIAHLFLQHTSASLAINENYDPSVRRDIEIFLNSLVPDGWSHFTHTLEGEDDMPAHVKNVLIGPSLTIPIYQGKPALGTWQGIYLLEHRSHGGSRELFITLIGE